MRALVPTLLLLGAAPTGCGTDVEVLEETLEKQIRWRQMPGEIQDCHVFKLNNTRHVEVNRLQVDFREGSHHVHLYRSNEPVTDDVFDCFNGIDWQKWSLVLGAQTKPMDWQLPEGVTIPLEPHQQLLAQVHWLNTTDEPVDETIDIKFHTTEESEEHLGVLFGVNQRINLAPGQQTRVNHFCEVPEGAKLHALMGHFHVHGRDYRMVERMPNATTGRELYFAPDEPSFDFKLFSPAHEVQPGAGFEYECGFFNWEGYPLTWGSDTKTQEHCNMTAYFSPAEDITKLCLLEPSKLSQLKPFESSVRAGRDLTFEIELAEAEAEDVTIELVSSDPTVLEVPADGVHIAKGQTKATFTARTRRPAQVEVSASLNGATIRTAVRVTGLVISELFYNSATGANDGKQWIEIANQTDLDIDLSKYSIGAGSSDFMRTRLGLPMTIPARGCIIVGGPESSPANHFPQLNLAQDLSPDLGLGGERAEGVALFATSATSIGPTTRPIDVVVYAGTNSTLRGPDGELAPVWPGALAGGSLRRVNDTVWTKLATPNPGNCEVLDAH